MRAPLQPGDHIEGTEHDLQQLDRAWQRECGAQHDGHGCTRLYGHEGQHEAAGLTHIQLVWP